MLLAGLARADDCATHLDAQPVDYACLRQVYSQPSANWPAPDISPGLAWRELAPLPSPPALDERQVELGRRLFFDPLLSRSGQIACASCHEPDLAFADGRRVSFGHDRQAGTRNAPSVAMASHFTNLFWDGRAGSLEQQALMPIVDPVEMAFTLDPLLQRLRTHRDYPRAFAEAFGHTPIDAAQLGRALATYQRTLAPRRNALDRFLLGDGKALSDTQLHGLHLFRGKARCLNCHQGEALSDDSFHNLGLTYYGRRYEDLGRYRVTGRAEDVGAFRTPSLRQVARTGPWMHNGLFGDLRGILNMYNAGMFHPLPTAQQKNDPLFPKTSPLLEPLRLNAQELQALLDFLQAL
ncbi:cytochrome c peroxidase [Pseudomonas citronellolis]|uniref:Cytochrome c peroxidase n=1 Tax=Pseudomonas citronellolis TaxID=53408 RepID=A0AAQ1KGC0_9PSED|nr:cytochrome c peroxidase [Pseudomonas citronellolis]MCP1603086.1 cytochrome c peroxidase [Pseudomonas citronellolis]MCP1654144.1 cytochrome c peroxidase [Pseudomonas citronellolis]MCP1720959.1 cytochrome c peroxidase [Pseudomonas citronellolis]UXJ50509.1 cytochrome-c peroxidase [Pseudomonas citronellolis]SFC94834.1 cytochrome c peroxidase [Pseudomonas citronellolis]